MQFTDYLFGKQHLLSIPTINISLLLNYYNMLIYYALGFFVLSIMFIYFGARLFLLYDEAKLWPLIFVILGALGFAISVGLFARILFIGV